MSNHLIIGLGGTGGSVLREFRKRIYEEFHSTAPTNSVRLDYLYVDSDPKDFGDRSGWRVMGKSVHLQEAQKVSIHGINANMFNNISMYPGINSFLSNSDVQLMTSKMGSLVSEGIGGQRRRLGRTLFANNLSVNDANSDFNSRLKSAVVRLTNDDEQAVTFHVCAGLAGGTGSGSIVDAIAQIRKEYPPLPHKNPYPIFLYLYIPEMNIVYAKHDNGFYQANGYAALSELNAMSVGAYHPLDVTGKRDNYTGEVQRLLKGINAFEGAYIYSNVNEAGKVLKLDTTLPASVADFLFQKIIAPDMVGADGSTINNKQMGRLVGCENDGAGPENDLSGKPTRSRKFLSFGIKRIEYPENEIEEYVTYNYARQAARQLQYNFWQEGVGYGESSLEEVGGGFVSEIEDKKKRDKYLLSDLRLMLSIPVIDGEPVSKRWLPIDETWSTRTQDFATETKKDPNKKRWIDIFNKECDTYFNEGFRSHGVKKFYDIQRSELTRYSKHIRRHIEEMLFNEWHNGEKSILEAEKFTRLLLANLESRQKQLRDRQGACEAEIDDCQANIRNILDKWDHIGWLKDAIMGTSANVFKQYVTAKCDLYTTLTRIEALRYACELIGNIMGQLNSTLEGITHYRSLLTSILDEVTKQADSRCQDNVLDESSATIKQYDPERVKTFVHRMIVNKDYQQENSRSIRNNLVQKLGDDGEKSFANLCAKTDFDTSIGVILEICQANARSSMEDAAKSDPLNKMLGVNILEKIKQECNTDEKLEKFVTAMKNSAKTFLQFNPAEAGKQSSSATGGKMQSMIQLCIPLYDGDTQGSKDSESSGIRNELIKKFGLMTPGFNPSSDVCVNYKSNQIVIVAANAGFPLRYVSNVKVLKQKYDDLLAAPDKELNRFVLHTESFAQPLPALYELETAEIEAMITPTVLLAYAMKIVQPVQDPTTQERFHAMISIDEFGITERTRLGKDLFDTINFLSHNYAMAMKLKELVEKNLKTNVRSNDQKAEMRKAVVDVIKNDVLNSRICEGNDFHPEYIRLKNISREIFNKELKEI